MKKFILLKSFLIAILFMTLQSSVFSQGVVISESAGATADSDAILDIQSTTQGILIPRMTTTQRNNLTDISTPDGLLIYDTTVGAFYLRGNNAWVNLSSSAEIWSQSSSNVYLTKITNSLGIGTNTPSSKLVVQADTDAGANDPLFQIKDKTGQTIMSVTSSGVRIYQNKDMALASSGGFAVGQYPSLKSDGDEFFKVTPFQTTVNTLPPGNDKGKAGGFAVGQYASLKGGTLNYNFYTNAGETRIYTGGEKDPVKNGSKAVAGGFAVGQYGSLKGVDDYMHITPDNYFIGHSAGFNTTPNLPTAIDGIHNIFVGYQSGLLNTSGHENTYIGHLSGENQKLGTDNVFLGNAAGQGGSAFSGSSLRNVALGVNAGRYLNDAIDNVIIGHNAGMGTTAGISGDYNILIGEGAANALTSGQKNVILGNLAGAGINTGSNNTFIGTESGRYSTSGIQNTFMGYWAGQYATGGNYNVAIGVEAGRFQSAGEYNTYLGNYAGRGLSSLTTNSGSWNVYIGDQAGLYNTSGSNNIYMGYKSGFDNTTGSYNINIGRESGTNNVGGEYNVFLGYQAGFTNQNGSYNTYIGYQTGYLSTGSSNSMLGNSAGYNNTTGSGNTFMGNNSGFSNQGGEHNSFFGTYAGRYNQSGSNNTALGYLAAERSGGAKNTSVGAYAGYHLTGTENVFLGAETGYQSSSYVLHNGCVFIGYAAGSNLSAGNRDNKLIIDNDGYTSAGYYKNPLIYGEFDNKILRINGTLSINQDGNDFTFPNSRGSNGNVLISNGNGTTGWGVPSSTTISARNGLSMSGSYVELGGSTLNKTTNINLGLYPLNFTTAAADANVTIEADSDNNNENHNPKLQFRQDGGAVVGKMGFEGNTPGTLFSGSLWNTFYMVTESDLPLQLGTNNTARLTIENAGDVGIGTTNPGTKLDVAGIMRTTSGTWPTTGAGVEIAYVGGNGYIQSYDRDNGLWKTLRLGGDVYPQSTTTFDLGASTNRWNSFYAVNGYYTGNVGIGTASPNSKLHVNSSTGENALRVQVAGSTRLLVSSNGGVSVGYNATPPTNGLLVSGNALPRVTQSYDLGSSTLAWNHLWIDFYHNVSKSFDNKNISEEIINYKPKAFKDGTGTLDPSSLPIELRSKGKYILGNEMNSYNYQLNYEQQLLINKQEEKIKSLEKQIQELRDLIQK